MILSQVINYIFMIVTAPKEFKAGLSKDGTFEVLEKMNVPRSYHQSSILQDGRILITGGYDGSSCGASPSYCLGINSTEIYNPATKTFEVGPNMNLPHLYHRQFTLNSGKVIIADINGIEIYDPGTNTFSLFQAKIKERIPGPNFTNYILLPDDNILVTGGAVGHPQNNMPMPHDFAEIIDTKNEKVINLSGMNIPRMQHSAIVMNNGKAYIIGGTNFQKNCSSVEEFDVKTGKFRIVGDIEVCFSNPYLKGISSENFLLFYGKSRDTNENSFQIYSTKLNKLIEKVDVSYDNSKSNLALSDFYQRQQPMNDELFIIDYEVMDSAMSKYTIAEKNKNYKYSLEKGILAPLDTKYSIPLFANLINLSDDEILVTGGMNERKMYSEVGKQKRFLHLGQEMITLPPACYYYYFCPYPRFVSKNTFIIKRRK